MASVALFRLSRTLHETITDPFGFTAALRHLHLSPEDLPQLTRESRLEGSGG